MVCQPRHDNPQLALRACRGYGSVGVVKVGGHDCGQEGHGGQHLQRGCRRGVQERCAGEVYRRIVQERGAGVVQERCAEV